MIVWPATSSSTMIANRSTALTQTGQSQATRQRRQDDEDDQDDDLEPEAAEARAALGVEVRRPCTGPGRSGAGGGAGSDRRADRAAGPVRGAVPAARLSAEQASARPGRCRGFVGHEAERYGRRPRRSGSAAAPSDSAGAAPLASPSTTSTPGSARRIAGGRDDLPRARPAAEDDPLAAP